MNKKISLVAILSVALMGGLSACNKGGGSAGGKDVIYLASVAPLSGGTATAGKDNDSGARLAVEEINAKGGVEINGKKYTIELISEDDGADPKQGPIVAQKVVDHGKVLGVIGHYNSGVTMAANPVYAKANLFTVTPSASNPDVVAKSMKTASGSNSSYRMVAHDGMQGPALAAYANKIGIKKVAIIDDATTYGKGLADKFEGKAKELGMDVVYREATTDKATDFKAILTKIKASEADAIVWGGLEDTAATLTKQARELGLQQKLLMFDAVCTDNYITLSGDTSIGVLCSVTGVPLSEMPEGAAFKERFEKRFNGQKVQGFAPFAYDAVYTVVEAIKKAGTTEDSAKVAAAMEGIQAKGLSGNIAFEPSGERKDGMLTILEQKGKEFVPIDKAR